MSVEAMKQALEALKRGRPQIIGVLVQQDQDAAITSLRQAIEQAEKMEPVAWRTPNWGHGPDEWAYFDADDRPTGANGPTGEALYTTPQPQQDAWKNAAIRLGEELSSVGPDGYYNMTAEKWLDWAMDQQPRGKNSLSQPQQEPVCPYCHDSHTLGAVYYDQNCVGCVKRMTATSQPQREWVGLTDEEIAELRRDGAHSVSDKDFRAIEAKLKEKNNG